MRARRFLRYGMNITGQLGRTLALALLVAWASAAGARAERSGISSEAGVFPTLPTEKGASGSVRASRTPDAHASAAQPIWRPTPQMKWQLQFAATPVDMSVDADVFEIDLFDNDAAVVAALRGKGKRVVCYLNAGAWEDWRPDAKRFPAAAIGGDYAGWPGERWLDIRRIDLLAPVMLARLDLCRQKGFDGARLDNVDAYTHRTGFPLRIGDQLRFNTWIAVEARKRGLAIGINNNPELARRLVGHFDWALAESCVSENWCGTLRPFVEAGKPVVVVEYGTTARTFAAMCRRASALNVKLLAKNRELDAYRADCDEEAGRGAGRS
jgi:hypothetical protein